MHRKGGIRFHIDMKMLPYEQFPTLLTILGSFSKIHLRKRILCRETGPQEPSGQFFAHWVL